MKKISFYISLLIILVSSCSKDSVESNNVSNNKSSSKITGMYNVGLDPLGWLVFEDRNQIVSTIEGLQTSDENYDLQFETCLNNIPDTLSDEEEEQAVLECGYIENKPVLDFEASFGSQFISLRSDLEDQVNTWLNTQVPPLNFSNMPSHYIDDPYTGCVFNKYGEVQVGGIVYFTWKNGQQVGIEREYLTYEIVQNLRILFATSGFNPNTYNHDPLLDDSLKSAFLYGEQINMKRVASKDGGDIVAGIIIVGAAPITVIWDAVKWAQNPNGSVGNGIDCNMSKFLSNEWSSGNYQMKGYVKLSDTYVIGQWAKSKVEYFKGNKRKRAKLKIRADVDVFNVANAGGCVTTIDIYRDMDKEKKKKKMSKIRAVGLYHEFAIHNNTTQTNYLYAELSKDGNIKITIH